MQGSKSILRLAVAVASLTGVASAPASIELLIDAQFGSTENTGVTALVTLELSDHGKDDFLTLIIENTTSPKIGSKLTAVGFELPDFLIDPPSLVLASVQGYLDTLTLDDSVAPDWLNPPGGFDAMISGDGDFQGGSPQGAPTAGGRESLVLNLGPTGMSAADLEIAFREFYGDFAGRSAIGRFQVIGAGGEGSDKVGGGLIPEPTSLVLLAAGGSALLGRHRRR